MVCLNVFSQVVLSFLLLRMLVYTCDGCFTKLHQLGKIILLKFGMRKASGRWVGSASLRLLEINSSVLTKMCLLRTAVPLAVQPVYLMNFASSICSFTCNLSGA